MKKASKAAALSCAAALSAIAGVAYAADPAPPPPPLAKTIAGWPAYIAMGAIGGPNITPPTLTSRGGNDDFGGRPVDVVFKYAGFNGAGDMGIIVAPTNVLRMTGDLTTLSAINNRPMRVAIVEYMAQMSGGLALNDFTNAPDNPAGSYIMARHFISLAADAMALNDKPVVYNGRNYYGTIILNPDLLGAIQQGSGPTAPEPHINLVNDHLPANRVNEAVDMALCFMTTSRSYTNTSNPNGLTNPVYLNKTYTGTPVAILEALLADGYPVWSLEGGQDAYWNAAASNLIGGTGTTYSQVGAWFNLCSTNPTYSTSAYPRPNFAAGFEGWVQANNWLIRTFSPKGRVTFGWQENMWANPLANGFWMHNDLTDAQIASTYSTPISTWISQNAPSAIKQGTLGPQYVPDYFAFDRYEFDDSADPGQATLYNARSWDNYLTGVGQVSRNFNNIPIMLWQIPGGHIPYVGEANPPLFANTAGQYVFSSAPVYFFGDSNLTPNLSNIISGPTSSTNTNTSVGNFQINCSLYRCSVSTYKDYLLAYKNGQTFDWSKDNGRLKFAAKNNVFAILWGGGNTTNVIKNFNNPDDKGWLSNKIIAYYQNPTLVPSSQGNPHDFNGGGKSDIAWRDSSGNTALWMMNGASVVSSANLGNLGTAWTLVGQRDFDGDSKSDLLWRHSSGTVAIWFMNGGTVQSSAVVGSVPSAWTIVGTGDVDGDGKGDLLWRDGSGNTAVWFMDGGTVTSSVSLGNVPLAWTVAAQADFNGDRNADILWRDGAGNTSIWFMDGTGVTSSASVGTVGAPWSIAATGDFDGDGNADLLWRDTSGNTAVWLMNGGAVKSTSGIGVVPSPWTVTVTGDFDGDAKADILWRNTSSGDTAIWFMNGTSVTSSGVVGSVPPAWTIQATNAN